jgi:hypothetical protein
MMKKPRMIVPTTMKCKEKSWEEREETLTLICDCGYHVMNNTCIHLRVKVLNIYMYKRGRIYKEPYEEI